jgi:hypothetical protein
MEQLFEVTLNVHARIKAPVFANSLEAAVGLAVIGYSGRDLMIRGKEVFNIQGVMERICPRQQAFQLAPQPSHEQVSAYLEALLDMLKSKPDKMIQTFPYGNAKERIL